MPADFESGFFGNGERAWHGLGTVIPDDVVTADRALDLAGLDWDVVPQPLYHGALTDPALHIPIASHVANVRTTDGRVLGVVGDQYRIVQNRDAFAFVDDLLDTGGAKFHTAGALSGGRIVWILARLPEGIMIAGENIDPFILFTHAHDGTRAITVAATPIRVVCRNTLNIALRAASRSWTTRHTSGVGGRLDIARRSLGMTFSYYAEFEKVGNDLAATKMSPSEFKAFLTELVPMTVGANESDSRAARNAVEARNAIASIYNDADNLANVRGTAWAAVNAVAEYADHDRAVRGRDSDVALERKWTRAMFDGTGLKNRALALVTS